MKKRYWMFILFFISLTLFLVSCARQPDVSAPNPPGFFLGLWHGFIAAFSLIGSIFADIRIYAYPNAGFWYDLGFIIGPLMYGFIWNSYSPQCIFLAAAGTSVLALFFLLMIRDG